MSAPSVTAAPAAARGRTRRLLAWGAAACAVSLAVYLAGWAAGWPSIVPNNIDLQVYVDGGLIIRHVVPVYDPHLASPLYDWQSFIGLYFTYTPFAAVIFALASFLPIAALAQLTVAVSVAALAASLWLTLHALGYRGQTAAGAALLATAGCLWLEPVQRTLFLGQVNLVLMLLVIADLALPESVASKVRGAGIGIAAGIKLVPLLFVIYLLLTRRYRQAAVAAAAFAATIAVGVAAAPRDSAQWWLHGLFLQGGRVGFPGVTQNQSLHGLVTRLAGSVAAGQLPWLAVAALTAAAGLAVATALHRAGHPVPGLLACALTGLLISPISWDHHWVWVAPGLVTLAHYALRAGRSRRAAGLWATAALTLAVFGARPEGAWLPGTNGVELSGFWWSVPTTIETRFFQLGDQPGYGEYHWHGLALAGGNLFVLAGLGLLIVLAAAAVRAARATTT